MNAPDYIQQLRRQTKAEVVRRERELVELRAFERVINPSTRPRKKRKRSDLTSILPASADDSGQP
jgi:hypothetical protein